MRVIAGRDKGRKLQVPSGADVRPTPAKVREALFAILADSTLDACVLDGFAGSGALGIEALSRGAKHCVFIEKSRTVMPALQRNVATVSGEKILMSCSFFAALPQLVNHRYTFDIVFLDPPYHQNLWQQALLALKQHQLIATNGLIVMEHPRHWVTPALIQNYQLQKKRAFGNLALSFWQQS